MPDIFVTLVQYPELINRTTKFARGYSQFDLDLE